MNKEIFEKYLQYRFEHANAITPGQRLEVLEEVRADAQRGMVPIDENTMASLDLKDPAVQAVLRGENVSMGAHSAKRKRGRVQNSDRNKLFIMAAIVLVPILLALLFLGYRGRAKAAANAPTETPLASSTPTTDSVVYRAANLIGAGHADPGCTDRGSLAYCSAHRNATTSTGFVFQRHCGG